MSTIATCATITTRVNHSSSHALIKARMELFEKYISRAKLDAKSYQKEGVEWCLTNELSPFPVGGVRGGFIADEMGLGKTIMMIGTMVSNFVGKTLIVVPPILLDQWFLQILRTVGHKSLIYHGVEKKNIKLSDLQKANVVITTYNMVAFKKNKNNKNKANCDSEELSLLHQIKWNRIIFDEAHHLRNSNTGLYAGVRKLKSRIRWLVSGTPIQNKKQDFYNLCSVLKLPASFYTESMNLKVIAKSFILKRTKKQVGIQMSDVIHDKNVVLWKNQKELDISLKIHSAFMHIKNKDSSSSSDIFGKSCVLTLMLRARQSCILPKLLDNSLNCTSKLDAVANEILLRKDNGCGKLIFCHFRQEMDEIASRLTTGGILRVEIFDSRTSKKRRSEMLREKNDVLIIQIQTGCEGLNLQENYSEIYFVSPHWNPSVEDQAVARCHRIGQQKQVYVKRFTMCDFQTDDLESLNIENYVNKVQELKRNIVRDCIDEAV